MYHCTMVDNHQDCRLNYCSSVCSFARTAHLFTCSALLASLAHSAALIRSLARSLIRSRARGTVSIFEGVSNHSAKAIRGHLKKVFRK